MMQFYPAPPSVAQGRPEYAYPAGPVATSPRMNWSPTVHPGAWGPYDFSAAYPAAYPPTSGEPRSPHYLSSPNGHEHPGATSHNIRDILGAHPGGTLPSEVAKTPSSYQKSPTSTAGGVAVAVPAEYVRSPTTPSPMQLQPTPGKPFEGIVYSEVPGSFYVPALPRLPGRLR